MSGRRSAAFINGFKSKSQWRKFLADLTLRRYAQGITGMESLRELVGMANLVAQLSEYAADE